MTPADYQPLHSADRQGFFSSSEKELPEQTKIPFADSDLVAAALESLATQAEESLTVRDILEAYYEIQVQAQETLDAVEHVLSELHGAELITTIARRNLTKQAQELILAATEIYQKGSSTVSFFGRYETLHDEIEIWSRLTWIVADFRKVAQMTSSLDEFVENGLPIIDRYLFDGRNIEKARQQIASILILENQLTQPLTQELLKEGIFDHQEDDPTWYSSYPAELPHRHPEPLSRLKNIKDAQRRQLLGEPEEFWDDFARPENGKYPEIVVVDVPDNKWWNSHQGEIGNIFEDYWRMDPHERPIVIIYTHDQQLDLRFTSHYQGFLFAETMEDLRNAIYLANDLVLCKTKPEFLQTALLAPSQERLYDNSDLREWESETADTYLSLKFLFEKVILPRQKRAEERDASTGVFTGPRERVHSILDCGTGEGRIGGMLARLGFYVMGLDISREQLNRRPRRIQEEGAGLRGEADHPGLSYEALIQLVHDGLVAESQVELDDAEVLRHYPGMQGNFLELHGMLNDQVHNWYNNHPDIDPYEFFNESPWNEYAFSSPEDYFLDIGFNLVLFNWHTFCEVGDPENQKEVLRQVFNVMGRGGQLVIEIPDRMVGPYAASLQAYHAAHPDEPLGTIRDTTSTEIGESTKTDESTDTPRYFPDRNELILLLQAVGFEIDPEADVSTYLITKENAQTGEKHLQAKELFIVARRPDA